MEGTTVCRSVLKSLNILSKCLKSTSNITKGLPDVKTFKSRKQFGRYSKFMIMDYLPRSCKIHIQNLFGIIVFLVIRFPKLLLHIYCLIRARKCFTLTFVNYNPGECILRGQFQHVNSGRCIFASFARKIVEDKMCNRDKVLLQKTLILKAG